VRLKKIVVARFCCTKKLEKEINNKNVFKEKRYYCCARIEAALGFALKRLWNSRRIWSRAESGREIEPNESRFGELSAVP